MNINGEPARIFKVEYVRQYKCVLVTMEMHIQTPTGERIQST